MSAGKYVVWIIEIIVIWASLFLLQLPIRSGKHAIFRRRTERCNTPPHGSGDDSETRQPSAPGRSLRVRVLSAAVFCLKLILIPLSAALFVSISSIFSYRYGFIVTALYIVLTGDVISDIIVFAVRLIRRRGAKGAGRSRRGAAPRGALSAVCCVCITVCGVANAGGAVKKVHSWKAEGLTKTHTFAFVSDIHSGSAQSMDTLAQLCGQINAEKPEFVILGGDITDELTSYDDMIKTFGILSEIDAPVYYIYGNHDRQNDCSYVGGRTYSDEQLAEAVESAGFKILADEFVKADDDLILLGREDMSAEGSRMDWNQLLNPYEGSGALIVADHQPYDELQLESEKSALQLSGHTHAGQLWPLQNVYRLLDLEAYGEFEEKNTLLYVSAGAGVWMVPFRTEQRCEWELITLYP